MISSGLDGIDSGVNADVPASFLNNGLAINDAFHPIKFFGKSFCIVDAIRQSVDEILAWMTSSVSPDMSTISSAFSIGIFSVFITVDSSDQNMALIGCYSQNGGDRLEVNIVLDETIVEKLAGPKSSDKTKVLASLHESIFCLLCGYASEYIAMLASI